MMTDAEERLENYCQYLKWAQKSLYTAKEKEKSQMTSMYSSGYALLHSAHFIHSDTTHQLRMGIST